MTTVASNPRRELHSKPVPARRVRPIGGDMNEGFGEIDRYPQNEISPKARELTEKPVRAFGMPTVGTLHFGTMPVEIGHKALDLSGKTTKIGLNLAKGLGEGFADVLKMFAGDQSKPKTPEAKAKEQKTQEVEAQSRFLHQKTAGTEQMISNEAKRRMQEAVVAIAGHVVTEHEAKARGHQKAGGLYIASSIARERTEKIAAEKRKRYNSGIGSPAKKDRSQSGATRSTTNTAMQEGNSAVGGSGGDNTA